jgi:DNA-binding phage protein
MSLEMNRRKVVQASAGTAALISAFGVNRSLVAQDASPEASPEAETVITVAEGPVRTSVPLGHPHSDLLVRR